MDASGPPAKNNGMTRPSKTLTQFDEFAARFVRQYWQDVADNVDKLPPYEPCTESVDEILATINISTSYEEIGGQRAKAFVLRMMANSGSIWRFAFMVKSRRWKLLEAFANDETNEFRVDMLGDNYGEIFRPILDRTIRAATI